MNKTIVFNTMPSIISTASIVGKKEGQGPLRNFFDVVENDTTFGQNSWEKAESEMQKRTANLALQKINITSSTIDVLFAGDLLNQCISSSYGLKELSIPFLGLYGACSTMAQGLLLSAIFVGNDIAKRALAVTSSHFCSAERQFRYPLEYGGQRTPTAQWTVTGAGAIIVEKNNNPPFIKGVTIGKIIDLGVKDINNMGAAMAPAAAYTIKQYLIDTNTLPKDYDLILTGDLGILGSTLLIELLKLDNIDISANHNDCGKLIFNTASQDVHCGGSGCGCSGSVFTSIIMSKIKDSSLKNVLFVATGALMSPTSTMQKQSIPAIAHLVHIVG